MQNRSILFVIDVFAICLSFVFPIGILIADQEKDSLNHSEKSIGLDSDRVVFYQNPIKSTQNSDWDDYGIGDPFIMRFNGVYYLYCSTKDTEIGIKCWSSRNLADWKDEGLCASDPLTQGAYAPEVFYYNGRFYLYTSPRGKGHYILSAESPTGPFCVETTNLGLSIDGSVFIDDNGDWFFYHASESGILAHFMTSPLSIDPTPFRINAFMNGWTEGPTVIKYQDRYYLTYTGNHVFCRGYRIDAGSGTSPLQFFPFEDNPILINTENDPCGIGHNSIVKGPDLINYYIVYHSLTGRSAIGAPTRLMNIDRIIFNGSRLSVAGPTTTEQIIPLPPFSVYFDQKDDLKQFSFGTISEEKNDNNTKNKFLTLQAFSSPINLDDSSFHKKQNLSKESGEKDENRFFLSPQTFMISRAKFDHSFVAEFNVSTKSETGEVGAVFCHSDSQNYGLAGFDPASQKFRITFVVNGEETIYETELPRSFNEKMILSVLQSLQIEKTGTNFRFYINNRLAFQCSSDLASGSIGYYAFQCQGCFGYIGGSHFQQVQSLLAQPIPGSVDVVSCSRYHQLTSQQKALRKDGSFYIKQSKENDSYSFLINIENEDFYDFSLQYATVDASAAYSLFLDDEPIGMAFQSLSSTGNPTLFQTEIQRRLKLPQGQHQLTIKMIGTINFSQFSFCNHSEVSPFLFDFSDSNDLCSYSDGSWSIENEALVLKESRPFGKRLYGDSHWGDYSIETEMTFLGNNKNAGLVFRVQNPSNGGPGNNSVQGIDFIQGYFLGLKPDGIVLGKHNYNWTPLAHQYFPVEPNRPYHLRVELIESNIKVYVDHKLLIQYFDSRPFIQGKAGFRSVNSSVLFDNLKIEPLTSEK
ncbi:MAG: family 43 glycosylhydrolase [Planctomycetia bacterium]|nr:family 43 glycosylhydrolase [Planctomycetia bacterium]